jgi:hypothetical protein
MLGFRGASRFVLQLGKRPRWLALLIVTLKPAERIRFGKSPAVVKLTRHTESLIVSALTRDRSGNCVEPKSGCWLF